MKDRKIFRRVIMVLTAIVYLAITGFFLYAIIDAKANSESAGLGIALMAVILISYGSIAYGVNTVISIIGFFTLKGMENPQKRKLAKLYFVLMTLLPYISEAILIFTMTRITK